ncbi:ROK family protein [Actinotalea sp. M2MS4P-6]|uniref:ROK family protein n=1 Tax=Actinotalea sp. M2MS4P-6 TaxID=2983762 RepID=UPI0021E4B156|nr:ROK family protein [Actinotalea sp. M2MS4P-6]MCV2394391.1 ROK family protein [Actinotalea sp. M2MS4P-6]
MVVVPPQDPWAQVAEVVRLIRGGEAQTRPELADVTRLGRNVISQRVQAAHDLGLVRPSGDMRSRGGRAADVWEFCGDAGHVLVGLIGTTRFTVALAGLNGDVLDEVVVDWKVAEGPEASSRRIAQEMRALLAAHEVDHPWGIGIALPAPIEFTTGRSADPVAPSSMNYRWPVDFDIRQWFIEEFRTPTFTDSVIHMVTLGAAAAPDAPDDLVYVRIGTGLGAGLVSGGRIHRGATWVAGELNHVTMSDDPRRICPCGRVGCLETYCSGWAMIADAQRIAASGASPYLAKIAATRELELDDLGAGVDFGDAACVEVVAGAADMLGRALATVITLFNPARVTIGGFPISHNGLLQRVVERAIRTHTLAASIAGLEIVPGDPEQREGIHGAAELVVDALLAPESLATWGPLGSPVGVPELLEGPQQPGS